MNTHFHTLLFDGVFHALGDGDTLDFRPLPPPTDGQVGIVLAGITARVQRLLQRIDVHVGQAVWLQPSLEDALPELRKQACLAGTDAIADIEELRGGYLETRMLHLVATAIKWR